jgi:hypothetical protein
MSEYLENNQKKHRVIGIRYTLKAFKREGLIDDDNFYPDEAVGEIKDELLIKASKWYKIGAKRGVSIILESIINGDLEVKNNKYGKIEIIANVHEVAWNRSLNVMVGNEKKKIKKKKYKLKIEDLDFE